MSQQFQAPKNKVLFHPGQPCPGFVRLEKGTIRVTLTGASGREVVLYRVRPGDVCLQTFTCLVDGSHYAAEGVAETDLEGELIAPAEFQYRMRDDDDFRAQILSSVARRFAEYQSLIEDVALSSFDSRLAGALLRLGDANGHVDATHSALAAETASGRAYVTRRLSEFARRGLVRQDASGLTILDDRALRQIATEHR